MKAKKTKEEKEEMVAENYEAAFAELEKIVVMLENNELPLELSIEAFEKGMTFASYCQKVLDSTEARIEKILAETTEVAETNE